MGTLMNHVCRGPLKEIGSHFLHPKRRPEGGGSSGNCSCSGAGLALAPSSGNGVSRLGFLEAGSRRPETGSSLGRHALSQEVVLPSQRVAARPPRGASLVERWGYRAQVTGPERDGAARRSSVGSGRLQRGTWWGPEYQAEHWEPGRQRRGNEKQT